MVLTKGVFLGKPFDKRFCVLSERITAIRQPVSQRIISDRAVALAGVGPCWGRFYKGTGVRETD